MRFLKTMFSTSSIMFCILVQPAAATATPFSLTEGGLTAQFLAGPQLDSFVISNAVHFATLHGNTLIELHDFNNELGIVFSQPLSSLDLDFSIDINVPGNLDYQVYSGGFGGTPVASGSATGIRPIGFSFDEGHLTASASAFDAIVFSSPNANEFAIDNLMAATVTGTIHSYNFDTPEPFTLAVFGVGLLGVGALRRRRELSAA